MSATYRAFFPEAKYLYVVTWELNSGEHRSFFLEAPTRPTTRRQLFKLSASALLEDLEEDRWKYGENYPVPDSAVLTAAYKR